MPILIAAAEVPHMVIEPTMKCNIECRICYNRQRGYEKSLSQIKKEIDTACARRKLDTISLLGGEPTLHPGIIDIISYIKSKGLHCQLLTNGIQFLKDRSDRLLEKMIAAGIDRIILHADAGQAHIHNNLNRTIGSLFEKFEAARIAFSLAMTIYDENTCDLPGIIQEFSGFSYFDGVLATLARDARQVIYQKSDKNDDSQLQRVYQNISENLCIEPTTYLPSSLDLDRISWLIYFYYINTATGNTLMISPRLNNIFRRVYRTFFGHHFFGMTVTGALKSALFLLTMFAELLLDPGKIKKIGKLMAKSSMLKVIRFHYIVVQDGPRYNREKQQMEICYQCPDATIRNGMVTPVCLADHLNPLTGERAQTEEVDAVFRSVYEHLEEI